MGVKLSILLVISVFAAACSKPAEAPPPAPAPVSAAVSAAPSKGQNKGDGSGRADGSGRSGAGDGGGGGQQRFRLASVWVDGTQLAAVRYGELPPGLRATVVEQTTSEGEKLPVRRFRIADYLEALGVDVARVREVHVYGGRGRIGVLPGDELRKQRHDVMFSFTQGERGKPRLHWPRDIAVTDKIDMLNDLTVYVDKAPPTWNQEAWRLEIGGQPVEGIPYATAESGGGTRLYVDGRLARTLRRRSLGEPTGEPPRWPLAAQLAGAGVVLDQVQAVDLVDRDTRVSRLDKAAVATAALEVPDGSQGRVTVQPGGFTAEAILVFVKALPVEPR